MMNFHAGFNLKKDTIARFSHLPPSCRGFSLLTDIIVTGFNSLSETIDHRDINEKFTRALVNTFVVFYVHI